MDLTTHWVGIAALGYALNVWIQFLVNQRFSDRMPTSIDVAPNVIGDAAAVSHQLLMSFA